MAKAERKECPSCDTECPVWCKFCPSCGGQFKGKNLGSREGRTLEDRLAAVEARVAKKKKEADDDDEDWD